jgi:hypothetical protein
LNVGERLNVARRGRVGRASSLSLLGQAGSLSYEETLMPKRIDWLYERRG